MAGRLRHQVIAHSSMPPSLCTLVLLCCEQEVAKQGRQPALRISREPTRRPQAYYTASPPPIPSQLKQ